MDGRGRCDTDGVDAKSMRSTSSGALLEPEDKDPFSEDDVPLGAGDNVKTKMDKCLQTEFSQMEPTITDGDQTQTSISITHPDQTTVSKCDFFSYSEYAMDFFSMYLAKVCPPR